MVAAASDQLLSFRIEDERLAIPTKHVREVIRRPPLVRVPHAPAALVGLGNLRGTVLSVVSLATLMERTAGVGKRVIVLDESDDVGLLVDEVSALIARSDTQGANRAARLIDVIELLARGFARSSGKASAETSTGLAARVGAAVTTDQATASVAERILLAFAVGTQEFALPLEAIDEVIRLPDGIALLPQADEAVVGTAAHRSLLLPLLSLRHLLSLPEGGAATAPRVVIARVGRHKVGLVVDAVRAILRVGEDKIDAIPTVLTRGAGEAQIQAICRLDGGRRLISLLAADQLIRDDVAARLMDDQREQDIVAGDTRADGDSEQFLLFRIGDEEFGLPVAAVNEVVRLPDKLTSLPRAPAFIEGIMNLRGTPVPVIDQRRRFDAPAEDGQRRRVIIVSLGEQQAGFVVDMVSTVIRVNAADLRPAPDLGDGAVRTFDRVANLEGEGRMLLLIEPRELLDRAERDLLAAIDMKEMSVPL